MAFAAQLLGFPTFIPPYSRTRGAALMRGVNLASGASGIRDETGDNLVTRDLYSDIDVSSYTLLSH